MHKEINGKKRAGRAKKKKKKKALLFPVFHRNVGKYLKMYKGRVELNNIIHIM